MPLILSGPPYAVKSDRLLAPFLSVLGPFRGGTSCRTTGSSSGIGSTAALLGRRAWRARSTRALPRRSADCRTRATCQPGQPKSARSACCSSTWPAATCAAATSSRCRPVRRWPRPSELTPLGHDELVQNSNERVDARRSNKADLLDRTPLWYYILKEAEVRGRRASGRSSAAASSRKPSSASCSRTPSPISPTIRNGTPPSRFPSPEVRSS